MPGLEVDREEGPAVGGEPGAGPGPGSGVVEGRLPHVWTIELRRSRSLAALLLAAHVVAGGSVIALTPLPVVLAACLAAGVAFSAWRSVRGHAWLSAPDALVALAVDGRGAVQARLGDGRELTGRLLASSMSSPLLTVVRLSLTGRQVARSAVLLPGNCDDTAWRRLRVALAWKIGPGLARSRADGLN
jgi:hypothetical protein